MHLYQKQKAFSEHTWIFFKLTLNFDHFQKKKMTAIAYIFPILRTLKHVVR